MTPVNGEIFELPEHAPEGGSTDWPTAPVATSTLPARAASITHDIDRLLNAAREALEQTAHETSTSVAATGVEAPFTWPRWTGENTDAASVPAMQGPGTSQVQIVLGSFQLTPSELIAFQSGSPVRWASLTRGTGSVSVSHPDRLSDESTTGSMEAGVSAEPSPTVEIRVGGQLRARGVLMSTEGRYAVQLREVFPQPSQRNTQGTGVVPQPRHAVTAARLQVEKLDQGFQSEEPRP